MNDYSAAELATRDVAERIHNLESAVRKDQAQTAAAAGLPRDLVATQESVWRRISPLRNKWPEVLAFDMRVVELEQRQAEIQRELADLHARANAAPDVDAMVLADWELGDRKGPRPEPTLPGIQDDIRERQGSWEALTAAINKVLAEKVAFFERNRGRLVKQADRQAEEPPGPATCGWSTSSPRRAKTCADTGGQPCWLASTRPSRPRPSLPTRSPAPASAH